MEKRDYSILTDEELNASKELESLYTIPKDKTIRIRTKAEAVREMQIYMNYPGIKNHNSFFPNQYINPFDIKKNSISYIQKLQEFINLLEDRTITERDVLNHIRDNQAQFIICSGLRQTNYGHHDRYIFQEFPLPPNHQADFLIIGKNSHGYNFLFVELENPYGNITIKDGNFGNTIRKGLIQIEDWKSWIEKNFPTVRAVLNKSKSPNAVLPSEFIDYDNTRVKYLIIAGRREHYREKTNLERRKIIKQDVILLHYDNLIDYSRDLISAGTF